MTQFKCPYCKVVLIKDLETYLEESNNNFEECCICNGLIWRTMLEKEIK